MAPLPSNERVKALILSGELIVGFMVGTGGGPGDDDTPWTEQWFFFGDTDGQTYGNFPDQQQPEALSVLGSMLFDSFRGGPPPSDADAAKSRTEDEEEEIGKKFIHKKGAWLRSGRGRRTDRAKLRARILSKPNPKIDEVGGRAGGPSISWETFPCGGTYLGSYHHVMNPAQDSPETFFDTGLKNLLDECGRVDLSGDIGYVYGTVQRRKNKPLSPTPGNNDWIEPLCAEAASLAPKVTKIYRGPEADPILVGYAYSRSADVTQQVWDKVRGVHQFVVAGTPVHEPGSDTKMVDVTVPQPVPSYLNSAKDFAAWLAGGGGGWPLGVTGDPIHCDYYYGCAYVTLDCDPDQNDRPQTPAQYPGS
ncbi:hypothetical protein L6R53_16220 [Myxococcota bacterium]|nr:hypothetical protein [Myxococcota bacterium]